MESDKEVLTQIVSERADKIKSEALEQIKHIQEQSERELDRILPDLMKQIENFSVFKLLDVLDVIRDGGIVRTGDYVNEWGNASWGLTIGNYTIFPDDAYQSRLAKGGYRITLIMEKLPEEED